MVLHALIYIVAAIVSYFVATGIPRPNDVLWLNPFLFSVPISAAIAYFSLRLLGWLPTPKNIWVRGIVRGATVTLAAHLMYGPISYVLVGIGDGHLSAQLMELRSSLVTSLVSLMAAGYTLPCGIAGGLTNELLVRKNVA